MLLGRVAAAFPPSVAKAAGVARMRAPIRSGELRRSIRPMVGVGFAGALMAQAKHAAAQEYGVHASYTIGAPGQILASRAPKNKPTVYVIPGRRSMRQNFGPVRGPVQGPTFGGQGFMRFAAWAWKGLYAVELRKRMGAGLSPGFGGS